MASSSIPIVDSHIHLYPESEIPTLAWCTPDNPLAKQTSMEEYRAVTTASSSSSPQAAPNLRGFVFLETDRRNDGGESWDAPLMEVAWLARIVDGKPRPGEGHAAADAALCLGVVPWAPLNLGAERLREYLARAEEVAGPAAWRRVKGFRFLLQDKEARAGLTDGFVEGLRELGRRGFVFDVGVDQHRRGRAQLEETVEMIDRAHEGVADGEKVVFVINHLCKPDLSIINQTDPSFIAWRSAMFTLSKCDRVYMKLSGMFSEMPDRLRSRPVEEIFEAVQPWLAVVLAAFGARRIMFGSDWPVCTVGVGDGAWAKWRAVVERLCSMASLPEEEAAMIWGGTAVEAYGLEI